MAAFDALYGIEEVALSIFQPRRANVETWTISTQDLIAWGENTVKPIAEIAARGEGDYQAGPWCQFCRIAPTCRARAESNLALAKHEFAPPAELSIDEVTDVLAKIPELKAWASNVEAWALAQAQAGTEIPGFKVVAGRKLTLQDTTLTNVGTYPGWASTGGKSKVVFATNDLYLVTGGSFYNMTRVMSRISELISRVNTLITLLNKGWITTIRDQGSNITWEYYSNTGTTTIS